MFCRRTAGDNLITDIREGADGDTEFPNCLPSPPAVFQIRFAVAMKKTWKPVMVGRVPLDVLTSSKLAGRFDDFRR